MLDRPLIITAIITIPPKVQWLSIRSIATPIFAKVSWAPKSNCSHEIKRCLFLGRKAMINLDSVLKKQRHHFANKDSYSQSYRFSISHVCMWKLDHKEGWVPKNWCFLISVLEMTLENPGTAKGSNLSILKEINPEYSLKGLMLKLKLQNFDPLIQRTDSSEKILMLGKIEGRKRRGQQRMR